MKILLYILLTIATSACSALTSTTDPVQDSIPAHSYHLYFGYGSNLSHEFLCERLKDGQWLSDGWHKSGEIIDSPPIDLGTYVLENHEFSYTLDLETETAGNVIPKEDGRVYGVLYRITEKQLEELDRTEDVPRDYKRVALRVNKITSLQFDQNLVEATAWVYVGNPDRMTTAINPDPQYVQLLVQAAADRGFPKDYIENYLMCANLIPTAISDSPFYYFPNELQLQNQSCP